MFECINYTPLYENKLLFRWGGNFIRHNLQVGAIAPQSLDPLMQSIHGCLSSSDWATRKAAAETLNALALHSSNLVTDGASSTLTVLEACRFDKVLLLKVKNWKYMCILQNIFLISDMDTFNKSINYYHKLFVIHLFLYFLHS